MAKKTKKKTARTPGRKPGRKPASAGGNLSKLSPEDLAAELQRREHSIRSLERKRAKLLAQLEEVERELSVSGGLFGAGAGVGGRRRRPRNAASLEDTMHQVLEGNTMGVSELADAVRAAGYVTTSRTFNTIVNQTLIKSPRFKKIAHGRYTTK